jgi:hypothetical protein
VIEAVHVIGCEIEQSYSDGAHGDPVVEQKKPAAWLESGRAGNVTIPTKSKRL